MKKIHSLFIVMLMSAFFALNVAHAKGGVSHLDKKMDYIIEDLFSKVCAIKNPINAWYAVVYKKDDMKSYSWVPKALKLGYDTVKITPLPNSDLVIAEVVKCGERFSKYERLVVHRDGKTHGMTKDGVRDAREDKLGRRAEWLYNNCAQLGYKSAEFDVIVEDTDNRLGGGCLTNVAPPFPEAWPPPKFLRPRQASAK